MGVQYILGDGLVGEYYGDIIWHMYILCLSVAWIMMLLLCVITVTIVMIIVMTKRLGWKAEM